jgi:hypothetical protein
MDKVIIELSWDEYARLLHIVEKVKIQVDTPVIDSLYSKLYMERKVIKGK